MVTPEPSLNGYNEGVPWLRRFSGPSLVSFCVIQKHGKESKYTSLCVKIEQTINRICLISQQHAMCQSRSQGY